MPGQEEIIAVVAKVLRAHCPPGGPATTTYLQADPEQIIEKLEPVIQDLVMLKEVRNTSKFLCQCAQMAFPRMLPAECKVFGERLLAACEHVVVKRKSATTGKKTPPAVYRIILAMNASDASSPVVPPLPTYTTPPRQILRKLSSSQTVSSGPSSKSMASKTSAASCKEAIASAAASVANFYDDMLGAVEGGEEENEECDDDVVSVSSESCHTFQYLSTTDMALVRISNGQKIVAKMKPGDSGFCIATFDSETEYQTELPNSTFLKYQESVGEANVKKKPSVSTKKRPAALLSTAAG